MLAYALALMIDAAVPVTPPSTALSGLTEQAAREVLGQPDVARREAKGALWTYRKTSCVLLVYLADKGDGLKVTGLSAGARRSGEQPPTVEACIADKKG